MSIKFGIFAANKGIPHTIDLLPPSKSGRGSCVQYKLTLLSKPNSKSVSDPVFYQLSFTSQSDDINMAAINRFLEGDHFLGVLKQFHKKSRCGNQKENNPAIISIIPETIADFSQPSSMITYTLQPMVNII